MVPGVYKRLDEESRLGQNQSLEHFGSGTFHSTCLFCVSSFVYVGICVPRDLKHGIREPDYFLLLPNPGVDKTTNCIVSF